MLDSSPVTVDGGAQLSLISDDDRPVRKRVELSRLMRFIVGVMSLGWGYLGAAYALLLVGLAFTLMLPAVEG